jgi:hypothetical protein
LTPEKLQRPELALGRLPVATSGELQDVILKIQTRESELEQPWVRSALLVADDPDAAGNFTFSSDSLTSVIPTDVPVTRAYISTGGVAQARSDLLAGINQGVGVVSYFGHAGYNQLADEGLLTTPDVAALVNGARPTLMTTMTCLAGNSALPGQTTIGEALVRQPAVGAAAFWAPSGMSENHLAEPLARAFYAALFTGKGNRIGDAVRVARYVYKASGQPAYMLSIYNLLGDPAMRVR